MCNAYRLKKAPAEIAEVFSNLKLPLRFSEGVPNAEPRDAIKITDTAPIVRHGADGPEMVSRRWSWPGPTRKPVFNFKSESRRFATGSRCLIPTDGFYEFIDPQPGEKLKTRWIFTTAEPWFWIAGIWRTTDVGEAWTMLTADPGPDIAPYHDRQVVVLSQAEGLRWLEGAPEAELLRSAPAGTLNAARA
jgi:putative SOS response-associated peptidase YedK